MQYVWLNKKNNDKLIVFFNGFGFDEKIVEHLDFSQYDVVEFHNYIKLEEINFDFSEYKKKYLIAWSLGVYVSNYYYDLFKNFDGYTAINGTLKPIDNKYGIAVKAYDLTINNFNELTAKKFIKKIGSLIEIDRNITDLKKELISIRDLTIQKYLPYKRAIISIEDKIFPYENMLNYWSLSKAKIEEIKAPHYVFDKYKTWGELI